APTWAASAAGQQRYKRRAGVEGTLSPGVRAFGLRRSRYWGLATTHVQHVAIAAASTIDRLVAWLDERPRAPTRPPRCAALAPGSALHPGEVAASSPAEGLDIPPYSNLCCMAAPIRILYYKNYFCSI